ncbi:hypothetical protein ACQUJZ_22565 [Ralstonia pseudosolanacearum]|uniref:hypothetical protein n=1 Tax=Ralstonia pseudosolanacearum TaxID=1310165 RepID=UPI0013E2A958|nr:hypothetical protein [Ralstonia pseudosolanacearum]MCK4136286.1 hypothetical protein [Ralstonia pseudosolanacearum]QVX39805.1 hypothetical protein J4H89_06360 [Ralstonia solanacearum]UQY82763.1 hypothetical protein JNO62_00960 [Ralstonia pseudosolanacearum]
MIYNERRATVLPQNAMVLAESATGPLLPTAPVFLFPFEIKEKEKESRENAGEGHATV